MNRLAEMDQYYFGQGTHYSIYKKLGAHLTEENGVKGVYFAVWAPNARAVSVVGDFNGWDKAAHPMKKSFEIGFWDLFIPGVPEGCVYKYCVNNYHGRDVLKADPYGYQVEIRPANGSRVASIENFDWHDQAWMEKKKTRKPVEEPMFIYEVHPGSWMKHPYAPGNPQGFYNYRELAHKLTDYVLDMGYTHVEFIGIAEHPFDGSWGYQVTNYFAPTSRHGSPKDFMYLVDYLHAHGIGVILDWVPAHFPKDEVGLAEFDGTAQYEYADAQKGNHPQWGTKIFDFGKNEVKNFLISNALYWIKEYHIDGLRVDAVASIIYLDFCREPSQWTPNVEGDNRNLEAIEFLKHLNSIVEKQGEGSIIIAEESTAWQGVTAKTEDGGLGFNFKWNMGWMNDFLKYMEMDPIYRQFHHNKMNFSMMYAYKENYIQVLSHDEVVHLKHSMLEKMPGPIWDKFANLKGAYTYMVGHPGKKLLFMGQEFGQEREWSEARELDWFLLKDSRHSQLQSFMRDLLHLYKETPCMYELDNNDAGFEWVNADDSQRSIFSFERFAKDEDKSYLFICNFTPTNRMDYKVGAYKNTTYRMILNSDDSKYGGGGMIREENKIFTSVKDAADNRDYSISFPLPAYAAVILEFDGKIAKHNKMVRRRETMKKFAFGVDVGGTTIKIGLFRIGGELIEKWEIPTNLENHGASIIDDITSAIQQKIAEKGYRFEEVGGTGIGLPGPVDASGIVKGCVHLGWGETDICTILGKKLDMPVRCGNVANVAALGESFSGAANGAGNCIVVTLGSGVGGGIIQDGKILSGVHGAGGEIGHMKINPKEKEQCACGGYGCLEQYVSAEGIVRTAKQILQKSKRKSVLRDMETITCKDIFDAAAAGDILANNVVAEAAEILGIALANLAAVCDPEILVIGGGVSKAGEILRGAVEDSYRKHAFPACKDIQIVLASLGNDAGMYGAVHLLS